MLGKKDRQSSFVMAPSLRSLIPDDHILVKVDRGLDLSWLPGEVAHLYAQDGRPGIEP